MDWDDVLRILFCSADICDFLFISVVYTLDYFEEYLLSHLF